MTHIQGEIVGPVSIVTHLKRYHNFSTMLANFQTFFKSHPSEKLH